MLVAIPVSFYLFDIGLFMLSQLSIMFVGNHIYLLKDISFNA